MAKGKRIRWANGEECNYRWNAKPGEVIEYSGKDGPYTRPAQGAHYCIKAYGHTEDITNDDHQCCCGNTTDE